ncbi:hypothetical protein FHR32_002777 [Streptosporangium album]|uniref:RsbT co-antagonist protein RsbRD N-terminal domain-containing protein n=1 Tax=Streptosporangium album TaxID=47479 RepID=A0A7W7W8M7_9ACTN|nr:hypothetical protein [Streptosporangium album]MBB4938472.1 hypothetical protein [Streptosporangium album]
MLDLHARMAPRVRELTAVVVARCASEVPFYREQPQDILDEEVSRSVAVVLGLMLRTLRKGDVLDLGDLTELIAWSARRAEERVPLEAALTAYLISAEVWWRALAETAEHAQLVEAGVDLLGRPPGLYRFDDVLVEYQLARPGAGIARLAAKLDPLNDHP